MGCTMWLVRLTLVFGLIGQLLWAQGSLTPRPPCMRQLETTPAEDSRQIAPKPCCHERPSGQEKAKAHQCCAGRVAASAPKESSRPA